MVGFECCRRCRERVPGCHSNCIKYKATKDTFDEEQRKIKESRWAENEARLARNDGIRRMMRKDRI
jgi:hypothetical protein